MTDSNRPSYPIIGPEEHFYGYVIGLSIEPWTDEGEVPERLLVTFEYGERQQVWEVPDLELWTILWEHLHGNGWHRKNTDDYGYGKVWIEKKEGAWVVDVP